MNALDSNFTGKVNANPKLAFSHFSLCFVLCPHAYLLSCSCLSSVETSWRLLLVHCIIWHRPKLSAMPTVVLMDVSLSMTRPVSLDGSEEFQRKNLAVHGLNMLFEHMASNYRLEFTALMAFSSLWELLVPFTRDYNALQVKCSWYEKSESKQIFLTAWVISWRVTLERSWVLYY